MFGLLKKKSVSKKSIKEKLEELVEVNTTVEETVYNHLIVVRNPLTNPKIMYFFKDGLRCYDKSFAKKVINCKEFITDEDIISAREYSLTKPHAKTYLDFYKIATELNNQVWNSITV